MEDHSYLSSYQDIRLNKKNSFKGDRNCEDRFKPIQKLATHLNRDIKVLDIGAYLGYFSLRLSEEFKGTFVLIECSNLCLTGLQALCKLQNKKNIILLSKQITLNDIKQLNHIEHFDIVIAYSVLHHFHEPFQDVFDEIRKLGDYLFFEHPNTQEKQICVKKIIDQPLIFNGKKVAQTYSKFESDHYRDTYLIENKKKPKEKGLGLQSFIELEGVFPSINDICSISEHINQDGNYRIINSKLVVL
jgi:2-polyprenyl-3-methyl-5-hydroxy-6-metoxy-1,4-benzoquinol methylase